jgi:L-alanine-DL-glutamate epimerase-like enolase superfamily enzyme
MLITDIALHKVAVPFREQEVWAFGRRSHLEAIVLEVTTDEGIVGLGEAAGYPSITVVEQAIESMKPLVIGEDPVNIERILKKMYILGTWHHMKASNPGVGGIEMACWDIVGKACGQPLVNLFGGRVRDWAEYFYYLSQKHPDAMAEDAKVGLEKGFSSFYIKVGSPDVEIDIARVSAVRAALGRKGQIRIDANEAWSTAGALRALGLMAEFDIELAEQPVLGSNLEEMAYLRTRIPMPLLANESSWTRYMQLEVIKKGAADVVSVDNQMDGGLMNLKRSAGLCEVAGLPVLKHSLGELGIAMYASAHVTASSPNSLYASQSYASFLADDVIEGFESLPYEEGKLGLPTGPGIGVSLDRDKIERYEEAFRRAKESGTSEHGGSFSPVWPRR